MWAGEKFIDEFNAAMDADARLTEHNPDRYVRLRGMAAMVDQKASALLTYLAILLAGVSIVLVGGSEQNLLIGILMTVEFVLIFSAAGLCLSAAMLINRRFVGGLSGDDGIHQMTAAIAGRLGRFNLAYWLAICASGLFAVLVLELILARYFL